MATTVLESTAGYETQLFGESANQRPAIATADLIGLMLDTGTGISDLIFSPGRPPQVERHGELTPVQIPGCTVMKTSDTAAVARLPAPGRRADNRLRSFP